jgi:hypothetical protein
MGYVDARGQRRVPREGVQSGANGQTWTRRHGAADKKSKYGSTKCQGLGRRLEVPQGKAPGRLATRVKIGSSAQDGIMTRYGL